MGLVLSMALSAAACNSQEDTDALLQNAQGEEITANENSGETVEVHGDGGHLVGDDDFTSVSFDDGTGIACDAGGCIF